MKYKYLFDFYTLKPKLKYLFYTILQRFSKCKYETI